MRSNQSYPNTKNIKNRGKNKLMKKLKGSGSKKNLRRKNIKSKKQRKLKRNKKRNRQKKKNHWESLT